MNKTDFQYYAFISYSRKNSKAASYLHKQLEHFRVPLKYVAEENRPNGKFLRPVFRDRRDLEAGEGSFTAHIKTAIEKSRYMIVLCSPESAASHWVNEEIKYFLATHNNDYNAIVPVILNGEPGSGGDMECLPEVLRLENITMRNLPSMIPDDGDDEKTGWENGVIQAMSYMLKVNREKVKATVDAEKVRQAKIYAVIGIAATIVFALLTAWAIHAERQATANEKRAIAGEHEAKKQQKRAENGEKIAKENEAEANLFYEHWFAAIKQKYNITSLKGSAENLSRHESYSNVILTDSEIAIFRDEFKEADLSFKQPLFYLDDFSMTYIPNIKRISEVHHFIQKEEYDIALTKAKEMGEIIYAHTYISILISKHQLMEAQEYIDHISQKNNLHPSLKLRKAHLFLAQGKTKDAINEYLSIINNDSRWNLARICYYKLAVDCFPNDKRLYIFYHIQALLSYPPGEKKDALYARLILNLHEQKLHSLSRGMLRKLLSELSSQIPELKCTRQDAVLIKKEPGELKEKLIKIAGLQELKYSMTDALYFHKLIQKYYRPSFGILILRYLQEKYNIHNRFLISLDLYALKLFESNLQQLHFFFDTDDVIKQGELRCIYLEYFINDIFRSLNQFFELAERCRKYEEKERCYSEIRKFLSEFTSDEISRYKELQEIQKKLDGIYDKNTK